MTDEIDRIIRGLGRPGILGSTSNPFERGGCPITPDAKQRALCSRCHGSRWEPNTLNLNVPKVGQNKPPKWAKPSCQSQTSLRFPLNTLNPDKSRHFGGKVVLLTSPRTFSAGEDMTVAFKQAKQGLIIGEPTGGSTGQPLSFDLPGGGTARIFTKHDSFADETDLGLGVQPDTPVHLSRQDVTMNRDSVLQAR